MWRGAALLLLCLVTFTFGLNRAAIQDSDEAFYAEAGREMLAGGDWITPHYNFDVRLQKPILFYWVIAVTYALAGVGEAAARTGAALSGVGLAFVAYFATRRWFDDASAWLAGAIVATSFGVVPIARQSLPDVPLAFFVSVACWCAIEAFTVEATSAAGTVTPARRQRAWLYASAVAAALGALTKGPIAVVLPAAVVLPLVVVERWRTRRWPAIARPAPLVTAVLLFLVVAVPWYVAVVRAQGIGYLHQFFIGENLDRFATSQNNTWRGYTYIPVIVFGLLPWSAFGLLWIAPMLRRLRAPRSIAARELRLACWTFGPFAVFFVSIGSQPRYILPCLVPIAILLAKTISSGAAGLRRDGHRLFLVAGGAAGVAIAGIGALFYRARPLLIATNTRWSSLPVLLMIGAGLFIVIVACLGRARAIPIVVAAAATAGILVFELSIVSPGRPEPVEVIAAAVRAAGPVPAVCACGAFARSLDFYTHLPTVIGASDDDIRTFLDQPDRVLAAVDAGALARIESTRAKAFPRLAEVSYVNTSAWQRPGDSLIHPDLRFLQRVILVSNR